MCIRDSSYGVWSYKRCTIRNCRDRNSYICLLYTSEKRAATNVRRKLNSDNNTMAVTELIINLLNESKTNSEFVAKINNKIKE